MKLYTEEQLRYVFDRARATNDYQRLVWESCDDILDHGELTPIELPSDEEAGVIALEIAYTLKDKLESQQEAFYIAGFQTCVQWMKEQIQGGNK